MTTALRVSIRRSEAEVGVATPTDRPLKIGRSKQCDIVLDDPAVSRVHAILTLEAGQAVLVDQQSQNGLWVEGQRLSRVTLAPGVVVAIGPYRLFPEPIAATAPQPAGVSASDTTVVAPRPRAAATARPEVAAVSDTRPRTDMVPEERPKTPPTPPTMPAAPAVPKIRGIGTRARVAVIAAAVILSVAVVALVVVRMWTRPASQAGTTSAPAAAVTPETPPPSSEAPTPMPPGAQPASPAPAAPDALAAGSPDQPGANPPAPSAARPPAAAAKDFIPATRRPGESTRAWQQRSRALTERYNQGRDALERGEPAQAIEILSALLAEEPGFGEAADLVARARAEVRAEIRRRAEAAFEEGARLEQEGNLPGALASYQRAERLDSEFDRPGQAITALRARMRSEAETIMRRARVEDAFGRVQAAIALYRKVVELLPEDDPMRVEAQQRLDKLQGIKQS